MSTKLHEREALKKIREIVEGLGEESYIARAFEGCFEMAEQNIDDDFWNSMKEQRDLNKAEAEKWMGIADDIQKELNACKQNRKDAEESAKFFSEKAQEYDRRSTENWNKFCEMEKKANMLEFENMKLKAKLYDLLCK